MKINTSPKLLDSVLVELSKPKQPPIVVQIDLKNFNLWDINIPFWFVVFNILRFAFASIPAGLILWIVTKLVELILITPLMAFLSQFIP